jgi:hypothetical protein
MKWVEKYIGVPYAELNCAELVARILLKEFGKHDEAYTLIMHNTAGTSGNQRRKLFEQHALDFCDAVTESEILTNDIVLLHSRAGFHMGILICGHPQIKVLHTTKESGCVAEYLNRLKQAYNIIGFYRLRN